MKNKRALSLTGLLVLALIYVFFITPAGANCWYLLTGNGFIIPKESSVFTFHVTKMNNGSGEWWLYGYDKNFYYHYTGENDNPYIKTDRSISCAGFNPNDVDTWCN
ncbi:hypothetical protein ACJJIF_13615 [Microbulbifer sp. SSSA002]|uniref:hypothetical protein n=1 Tax=Microbulbifer sp. SSSA002 TaxID=3243376 RepID=UPI0040395770